MQRMAKRWARVQEAIRARGEREPALRQMTM